MLCFSTLHLSFSTLSDDGKVTEAMAGPRRVKKSKDKYWISSTLQHLWAIWCLYSVLLCFTWRLNATMNIAPEQDSIPCSPFWYYRTKLPGPFEWRGVSWLRNELLSIMLQDSFRRMRTLPDQGFISLIYARSGISDGHTIPVSSSAIISCRDVWVELTH